ncbi:MAG: biotin--[Clostridia bacterium]|nr:biotin--[acetyl-CoA-carboxylase] ligase [Clostridia bacterium]
MHDILSAKKILSLVEKQDFYNLVVLDTVNSTNSYIKELAASGASHATTVIADSQTNGRGRLGREFFSPGGTGIYMSILTDPSKIKIPVSHLTIAAGVAACRTLTGICDASPSIKWVNDIFLHDKKVCGILAESVVNAKTNTFPYTIVGIGINVSTSAEIFPGKLSEIAGSVFPANITRNEIIAKLLNEFDNICSNAEIKNLVDEYKKYSRVLGKKISFTKNGKAFSGTAKDINLDGNLVVSLEDGQEMILSSGEVSLGSSNFLS